jgi:hypothetical protein
MTGFGETDTLTVQNQRREQFQKRLLAATLGIQACKVEKLVD